MSGKHNLHASPENGIIFALTPTQLSAWHYQFYEKPLNYLAQNICTGRDPINACLQSQTELSTVIQPRNQCHEVTSTTVTKPTTGGPSWICTGLDLLRLSIDKRLPLPDFELSAGHIMYWHKLERCNYFLQTVATFLERCEPLDSRSFHNLIKLPVPDGGNWQMFVNIVQKYGVMPKKCYLTSANASLNLRQLNKILRSKLREYVSLMHAQFTFDGDGSNLPNFIGEKLSELYKVINICLGEPPKEFTWSFYDNKKRYQCMENITAMAFYQTLIKPGIDFNTYVCLAHDPRPSSSYHTNYHIADKTNMVDGYLQSYNNQPMDHLIEIIIKSLSAGQAVWLACDLQSRFSAKSDVLTLRAHNFEQVFGMEVRTVLDKADRMLYRETRRDAALLLTGVTMDTLQQPIEFRTISTTTATANVSTISLQSTETPPNMAAKSKTCKGKVAIIQADWLREYAFEIVVSSRFVPPTVIHSINNMDSIELPSWDVMGALLR